MIKALKALNITTQAKLACAYSGVVWGLYWIPLRMMDEAGVYAAWSTVLFYAVPLLFFLPFTGKQWLTYKADLKISFHWIGITTGISLVLYANAMLYTEVVRGVLIVLPDANLVVAVGKDSAGRSDHTTSTRGDCTRC